MEVIPDAGGTSSEEPVPAATVPVVPVPEVPGYDVGRLLGRGATAAVWLVTERSTGREFALKCLDTGGDRGRDGERAGVRDAEEAIRREVRILSALDHDHLLRTHDVLRLRIPLPGPDEPPRLAGREALGLVLDYAAGGSAADLVAGRGRLGAGETVTVLTPIAQALEYLHTHGFTHGDVSPGNVLFTAHGKPLLADVGVARMVADAGVDRLAGTEGFCDPAPVDAVRAGLQPERDVYSLAALGWYCLTGQPPAPGVRRPPLPFLVPDVPAALAAALEAGLAEDRRQRPAAAEFAAAVYRSTAAEPVDLSVTAHPTVVPQLLTRRTVPRNAQERRAARLRGWLRRFRWPVAGRMPLPGRRADSSVDGDSRHGPGPLTVAESLTGLGLLADVGSLTAAGSLPAEAGSPTDGEDGVGTGRTGAASGAVPAGAHARTLPAVTARHAVPGGGPRHSAAGSDADIPRDIDADIPRDIAVRSRRVATNHAAHDAGPGTSRRQTAVDDARHNARRTAGGGTRRAAVEDARHNTRRTARDDTPDVALHAPRTRLARGSRDPVRRRGRRKLWAGTAAVAALLAGLCGAWPQVARGVPELLAALAPSISAPANSSPVPAPSTSANGGTVGTGGPSASGIPAELRDRLESADPGEAVRGLAALRSLAFSSGDFRLLEEVNVPASSAAAADDSIRVRLAEAGHVLTGFETTLAQVQTVANGGADRTVVDVSAVSSAYQERDAAGGVVAEAPAGQEVRLRLVLASIDGRWRIQDILPPGR